VNACSQERSRGNAAEEPGKQFKEKIEGLLICPSIGGGFKVEVKTGGITPQTWPESAGN